uniref:Uncharacterized protein n=1 Tax=Neurospora crassa TaxID=5141 RepID=Q6M948_NEUCS|nr:hypothetical protein [Neurospora crassa]
MPVDTSLHRLGVMATKDLSAVVKKATEVVQSGRATVDGIEQCWNDFCTEQKVDDNVVLDTKETRRILSQAAKVQSTVDRFDNYTKQAHRETKHRMETITNNVEIETIAITPEEAKFAVTLFDMGLADGIIQKVIDKDTETRIKRHLNGQATGQVDTQQDVFNEIREANEEITKLKTELQKSVTDNTRLKTEVKETQEQLKQAETKATSQVRKLEQRIEVLQSEQSDSSLRDTISRLEEEKLLLDKELKILQAQRMTDKQTLQNSWDTRDKTLNQCKEVMNENKSRVHKIKDWCKRVFQQDIDLLTSQKEDLKSELEGVKSQVSQLEKAHAEKVQGLDSQLSLSKRRLRNLEKDLEKKTTELSASEERVSSLQQQLEDVQTANVKTVQRLEEDLSASKECVHGLEKSLEEAQASLQADLQVIEEETKKLSALEAQLATSEGRVHGLEKSLEEAQLAVSERVGNLEKDLEKAQATSLTNLQGAEARIKELSASKERISELGKQLQEAQTASQELRDMVKAKEEQIKTQSENAEKLQKDLDEASADAREYRRQSFELQGRVEDLIVENRALQSENDEQGRSMIDMDEAATMMQNDKTHLHAQLSNLCAQVNAARNFKAEADQAQQEVGDLVSQVSGLTGALTKVNQGLL